MDIIPLNNRPYHHHNQYNSQENNEISEEDRLLHDPDYAEAIAIQNSFEEAQVSKVDQAFANCPIFLAPMKNPVSDEYGHSFELEAINGWAASTREGDPLICPLGREIINPDRLVNNRLGREGIECMLKMNEELEISNARVREQLKMNSNLKIKHANEKERLDRLESEANELNERVQVLSSTESGQMLNMMYNLVQSNLQSNKLVADKINSLEKNVAQLKKTIEYQGDTINILERECNLYKTRIENAASIGFFGRIIVGVTSVTPCVSYIENVMQSGTEELEQEIKLMKSGIEAKRELELIGSLPKQKEEHLQEDREIDISINNSFNQEI
jgi:hypothetical protein